jgi:thiopeptide-type bacteriocin biosynthesis protein
MQWLSYHIRPLEVQDAFLVRGLYPFLNQHVWPDTSRRSFFVRYTDDSGPHIRVRFGGDATWLDATLRPLWQDCMAGRGTYQEEPYHGEADRFGGPEPLAWAEEHFHVSTRVVLDRLRRDQRTYGDALFDALQMHTTMLFTAWMERPEAASYCDRLCNAWINNFFTPAEGEDPKHLLEGVLADFEATFSPQRAALRAALNETWAALRQQNHPPDQPEWLRWVRGNQIILPELKPVLDRVLPILVHLTNNRLGVNNQDETYLLYVLAQTLPPGK